MTGKLLCFLFLLCAISLSCFAQNGDLEKIDSVKQDTTRNGLILSNDTVQVKSDQPVQQITSYAKRYNPRKATLLAAVLPGAGQIYTRKYWKVPLVYGGFGFLIYAVSFSQKQYTNYRNQLFESINSNQVPSTQLRTVVDLSRRQRDYFLIINFFFYILQIVDAHVDAHLKEFDLNPKLQVRLESVPLQDGMMGRSNGVGLIYKFK